MMASWDRRYSRRQFIRGAAGVASGAVAMGSAGGLLAACGNGSTSTSIKQNTAALPLKRDPETLIVAMDAFVNDFDPASYFLLSAIVPAFGVYDSLMRMQGNSAIDTKPWLAERVTTNANKSVWTFALRPGVKYSDGTPFDANALKAAYTRTITANLGAGSTLSAYITDPMKQIVVKDPGTVVMDLGISVPRFDLLTASQFGMGIVNPKVVNQQGTNAKAHTWLATHSAGTGAYMVESVSPGSQIVMTQNPHYWGGWSGRHFKKIIILQVPEDSSRRQGMESGDFDIAFASTPQDTAALRNTPGIYVGNQKMLGMLYVTLGQFGPLASPLARQAVNLLFPIDQYVSSVMKGTIDPPHSVLPDLMVYSAPGTYTPTLDVRKAKTLLQQAGVKPGTQLTYEFYTGRGNQAGLLLQSQLSLVGLDVKILEKAYGEVVADLSTPKPVSQRPDMTYGLAGWWPEYNNPSDFCFPTLSSGGTPTHHLFNGGYYQNATVNAAVNTGFSEPSNTAALTTLWRQAQTVMGKEDPPWIPLGQIIDTSYLRTDVKGYVANPVYVETYDFHALSRA
jgi:peptide/nickel transport system substrate-binding protein